MVRTLLLLSSFRRPVVASFVEVSCLLGLLEGRLLKSSVDASALRGLIGLLALLQLHS